MPNYVLKTTDGRYVSVNDEADHVLVDTLNEAVVFPTMIPIEEAIDVSISRLYIENLQLTAINVTIAEA